MIVCVVETLPIDLVGFTARKKSDDILLEWQTAMELNNDGFEIQRSKDAIDWEIIDFVKGRGTVNELISYRYLDESPSEGTNYYRLKQLDFDGKSEFSKIVSVVVETQNEVVVFPNPVDSELFIVRDDFGEVDVQLFNILGQLVYQKNEFTDKKIALDFSDLENGSYFLNIVHTKTGGLLHQEHIIKN